LLKGGNGVDESANKGTSLVPAAVRHKAVGDMVGRQLAHSAGLQHAPEAGEVASPVEKGVPKNFNFFLFNFQILNLKFKKLKNFFLFKKMNFKF
jgi:hypothetical protein